MPYIRLGADIGAGYDVGVETGDEEGACILCGWIGVVEGACARGEFDLMLTEVERGTVGLYQGANEPIGVMGECKVVCW